MNSFAIAIFALSSVSVAYAANPASEKTVANNAANERAFKLTGRSKNTGLNALRSPIFPNGPVRCALCVE